MRTGSGSVHAVTQTEEEEEEEWDRLIPGAVLLPFKCLLKNGQNFNKYGEKHEIFHHQAENESSRMFPCESAAPRRRLPSWRTCGAALGPAGERQVCV